ncbi:hypothetical protein L207DRAFT_128627 [Hyaloscypha variabilis F]|uniref:Uncharacterized protein n=1 Tax=Hyaloscypha variabilis (strain UAMH 11265 / GT02V1 / F) TaxID=1149755 RepID=A0A2J6R8T0_HYAVF|nr:hypothetical protein L207DRAFT_128627 [Hyaloscypha variabilis F]
MIMFYSEVEVFCFFHSHFRFVLLIPSGNFCIFSEPETLCLSFYCCIQHYTCNSRISYLPPAILPPRSVNFNPTIRRSSVSSDFVRSFTGGCISDPRTSTSSRAPEFAIPTLRRPHIDDRVVLLTDSSKLPRIGRGNQTPSRPQQHGTTSHPQAAVLEISPPHHEYAVLGDSMIASNHRHDKARCSDGMDRSTDIRM